jgi:hypothetical protein
LDAICKIYEGLKKTEKNKRKKKKTKKERGKGRNRTEMAGSAQHRIDPGSAHPSSNRYSPLILFSFISFHH